MNENTNNKAVTLAQMIEAHKKSNAKTEALSARVDQVADASNLSLGAMYQQPKAALYCTESNLTVSGTGDITDQTLGDLMGDKLSDDFAVKDDEGEFVLDDNDKKQYDFTINDVTVGTYTEDTKLSDVLADISSNADAGVHAAYSKTTQSFIFTAKEAGADGRIELGEGLAAAMFGSSDKFAQVYGLELEDGESEEVTFVMTGFDRSYSITKDTTMEDVIKKLEKWPGLTASYDKSSGQLMYVDGNNSEPAVVNVKVGDEVLEPKVSLPYTPGQDAIFTAIKVNGEVVNVTDKAVDITVPTEQQIADAINAKISCAYKIGGSVVFADLPELSEANMGLIVNVTNKFTTTDDFVEGAGGKHPAGTNVVVVQDGETYKYDVMSGFVDLSTLVEKEDGKGLSSNDFTDEEKAKLAEIEIASDEEVAAALAEIYGE